MHMVDEYRRCAGVFAHGSTEAWLSATLNEAIGQVGSRRVACKLPGVASSGTAFNSSSDVTLEPSLPGLSMLMLPCAVPSLSNPGPVRR